MNNPTNNVFTSIVNKFRNITNADKLDLDEYNKKHGTNRPIKNGSDWDEIINLSRFNRFLLEYTDRKKHSVSYYNIQRHEELLQMSMCNKDQVSIEVYLPIVIKRTEDSQDQKAKLEKEENITSFFRYEKPHSLYVLSHEHYFIGDLRINPDVIYGDLIIPLTHLSKKCTIQNLRICRMTESMELTKQSILLFVFTYKEYMKLLKIVCDHTNNSRRWIGYGINN